MKNLTYLGLCWATTLGLVAAVLADQPSATGEQFAPQWAPQPRQDDVFQANPPGVQAGSFDRHENATSNLGGYNQQRGLPAPSAPQDRSIITGIYEPTQATNAGGQQRGELGVWLVESGGPGVTIQRITRGSAAEQAGLRSGDIILQVNGRGAASPQSTAKLIRQIPTGQSGILTIWRDGDQQQMQVTMQPVREIAHDASRQISSTGAQESNSDLTSRTIRLEQQINLLTQELHQMRQELRSFVQGAVRNRPSLIRFRLNPLPQLTTPPTPPQPPATPAASQTPPPPGFGSLEEKPAARPRESTKSPTLADEPAKTPTPAAETPPANDPFGSEPAPTKNEEKPKSDSDSKSGSSNDSLFQ